MPTMKINVTQYSKPFDTINVKHSSQSAGGNYIKYGIQIYFMLAEIKGEMNRPLIVMQIFSPLLLT